MSWETRFTSIVRETEQNISHLQKRLENYGHSCAAGDDINNKFKEMSYPSCIHRLGCYNTLPCGLCPPPLPHCTPGMPLMHYTTEDKGELTSLKMQIKGLLCENELQKKRAQYAADTVLEMAETFRNTPVTCPPPPPPPPPPIQPCSAAMVVKEMLQQWKSEVNEQITTLQGQLTSHSKKIVNIGPLTQNLDTLQREVGHLRQYLNNEIKNLYEQIAKLKTIIENTKTTVDALEANNIGQEEGRGMHVALPAQPANTFGRELRDTIYSLKDQIGLLEDYIKNKKMRDVESNKISTRIASALPQYSNADDTVVRQDMTYTGADSDYRGTVSTRETIGRRDSFTSPSDQKQSIDYQQTIITVSQKPAKESDSANSFNTSQPQQQSDDRDTVTTKETIGTQDSDTSSSNQRQSIDYHQTIITVSPKPAKESGSANSSKASQPPQYHTIVMTGEDYVDVITEPVNDRQQSLTSDGSGIPDYQPIVDIFMIPNKPDEAPGKTSESLSDDSSTESTHQAVSPKPIATDTQSQRGYNYVKSCTIVASQMTIDVVSVAPMEPTEEVIPGGDVEHVKSDKERHCESRRVEQLSKNKVSEQRSQTFCNTSQVNFSQVKKLDPKVKLLKQTCSMEMTPDDGSLKYVVSKERIVSDVPIVRRPIEQPNETIQDKYPQSIFHSPNRHGMEQKHVHINLDNDEVRVYRQSIDPTTGEVISDIIDNTAFDYCDPQISITVTSTGNSDSVSRPSSQGTDRASSQATSKAESDVPSRPDSSNQSRPSSQITSRSAPATPTRPASGDPLRPSSQIASRPTSGSPTGSASSAPSKPSSHNESLPASYTSADPATCVPPRPTSDLPMGPASSGPSRPNSQNASRPVSCTPKDPVSSTPSRPNSQNASRPASRSPTGPAGPKPTVQIISRPVSITSTGHASGDPSRASSQSASRPSSGTISRPSSQSASRPPSGSQSRPSSASRACSEPESTPTTVVISRSRPRSLDRKSMSTPTSVVISTPRPTSPDRNSVASSTPTSVGIIRSRPTSVDRKSIDVVISCNPVLGASESSSYASSASRLTSKDDDGEAKINIGIDVSPTGSLTNKDFDVNVVISLTGSNYNQLASTDEKQVTIRSNEDTYAIKQTLSDVGSSVDQGYVVKKNLGSSVDAGLTSKGRNYNRIIPSEHVSIATTQYDNVSIASTQRSDFSSRSKDMSYLKKLMPVDSSVDQGSIKLKSGTSVDIETDISKIKSLKKKAIASSGSLGSNVDQISMVSDTGTCVDIEIQKPKKSHKVEQKNLAYTVEQSVQPAKVPPKIVFNDQSTACLQTKMPDAKVMASTADCKQTFVQQSVIVKKEENAPEYDVKVKQLQLQTIKADNTVEYTISQETTMYKAGTTVVTDNLQKPPQVMQQTLQRRSPSPKPLSHSPLSSHSPRPILSSPLPRPGSPYTCPVSPIPGARLPTLSPLPRSFSEQPAVNQLCKSSIAKNTSSRKPRNNVSVCVTSPSQSSGTVGICVDVPYIGKSGRRSRSHSSSRRTIVSTGDIGTCVDSEEIPFDNKSQSSYSGSKSSRLSSRNANSSATSSTHSKAVIVSSLGTNVDSGILDRGLGSTSVDVKIYLNDQPHNLLSSSTSSIKESERNNGTDLDIGDYVDTDVDVYNNKHEADFGTCVDRQVSNMSDETSIVGTDSTSLSQSGTTISDDLLPCDVDISFSNLDTDIDLIEGYVDLPITIPRDLSQNAVFTPINISRHNSDIDSVLLASGDIHISSETLLSYSQPDRPEYRPNM